MFRRIQDLYIQERTSHSSEYRKSSIKPPGVYLQKKFYSGGLFEGGLIRGEGLFQKYTIHFPRKYIINIISSDSQLTPLSLEGFIFLFVLLFYLLLIMLYNMIWH